MKFQPFEECRTVHLSFWQCPPTLFILMGFITIAAMLGTYLIAVKYTQEPQVAALIVLVIAAVLFIVGNALIAGFTKIAEANRMKSEFIGIISHQLRSPLSIFKWTLDALKMSSPDYKSVDLTSHYSTLSETTERMIQLVNNLLEVGRMETGSFLLRKEPVDLVPLTEKSIKFFKSFATASNAEFQFSAEQDLPKIAGDSERLRMVIDNLIDNAIRYTPQKGDIVIEIKKEGPDKVRWSIKDQGVGIPKEYQKFIFTKFFRAPGALRYQTRGSGLGLYITKAIIEESGGDVGFESAEGAGATFWFRLPTK